MASLCLLSSLGCMFGVVVPMTPQAPMAVDAGLGVLGLTMAVGLWLAAPTSNRYWLHSYLVVFVGGISWLVAAAHTGAGALAIAMSYLWCVIYAAFFTSRRLAVVCAAVSVVGFGAALSAHPFPGVLQAWLLVSAAIAAVTAIVSGVVGRMRTLVVTDPLTGLLNRTGLREAATRELADAARTGRPLAVVMIDLDGFKQVNDRDGHAAGDRLLVALAHAWRPLLRGRDALARHGGDEFVLLLTDADQARLRSVLDELRRTSPVAWCAGSVIAESGQDLDSLLRTADAQLYRAKAARL